MLHRVHLAWAGFELTTLVVIGTDCIDSHTFNYHTMMDMTPPLRKGTSFLLLFYISQFVGITTMSMTQSKWDAMPSHLLVVLLWYFYRLDHQCISWLYAWYSHICNSADLIMDINMFLSKKFVIHQWDWIKTRRQILNGTFRACSLSNGKRRYLTGFLNCIHFGGGRVLLQLILISCYYNGIAKIALSMLNFRQLPND